MSKIRLLDEDDVKIITTEEIDEIIGMIPDINCGNGSDLPDDYEGDATDEDIYDIFDS